MMVVIIYAVALTLAEVKAVALLIAVGGKAAEFEA